ncbi:TPA: DNA-binding protein [Candidatus Uhrbacteria bacterium]|nr:DNA-binding protein [Candidatus Uhrbacteria bacterium]
MNKADLAGRIAERLGLTKKQGEDVVEVFQLLITESLARQDEVTIAGFGTFSSRIRSARMGVNPQKPSERIRIPEVLVPKFKAGKALKDALKAAQRPPVQTHVSAPTPPSAL